METIKFTLDDGSISEEVFVIAQTTIGGVEYFLVSDEGDEDTCYLLKDVSDKDSAQACFEEVTDEKEWESVGKVFQALLDEDTDLMM